MRLPISSLAFWFSHGLEVSSDSERAGLEMISGSERVGDRPGGDRGEGTAGGDEARVVGGVDRPVGKEEGEL